MVGRALTRSLRLSSIFKNAIIFGIDPGENLYGFYEGLYDRCFRCPPVSDPAYEKWIRSLNHSEKFDAAIVHQEPEVIFWSDKELEIPVYLPPPGFCHIAVSKRKLYEMFSGTPLIPEFSILTRETLLTGKLPGEQRFPCWMRDISPGSDSGKGSLLAESPDAARAWTLLNSGANEFMLADFLPGRNFACHLQIVDGLLVKAACCERMNYIMSGVAVSGITGNINRGRLFYDARIVEIALRAVDIVCSRSGERMHGAVTVDLREDAAGLPRVTEINIRHVAFAHAFAQAGFNTAESHLLITLGRFDELGEPNLNVGENNMIHRDVDGLPVWMPDCVIPGTGDEVKL